MSLNSDDSSSISIDLNFEVNRKDLPSPVEPDLPINIRTNTTSTPQSDQSEVFNEDADKRFNLSPENTEEITEWDFTETSDKDSTVIYSNLVVLSHEKSNNEGDLSGNLSEDDSSGEISEEELSEDLLEDSSQEEYTWVSDVMEISDSDEDLPEGVELYPDGEIDQPANSAIFEDVKLPILERSAESNEEIDGVDESDEEYSESEESEDSSSVSEGSDESESGDSLLSEVEHYVDRRKFVISVDSVPRKHRASSGLRRRKHKRSTKHRRRHRRRYYSSSDTESELNSLPVDKISSDVFPPDIYEQRRRADSIFNHLTNRPPSDSKLPSIRGSLKTPPISRRSTTTNSGKNPVVDNPLETSDLKRDNSTINLVGSAISNLVNPNNISETQPSLRGQEELEKLIEESKQKATKAQCRANLYWLINLGVSFIIILGSAVVGTVVATTNEINGPNLFVIIASYSISVIKGLHDMFKLGQRGVFFKFMSNQIRKIVRSINESMFYLQSDYEILHFANNVRQEIDDLEFSAFKMTAGPLSLGAAQDGSQATHHEVQMGADTMV